MSDDWMQVLKRDLQEIEPDLIKLRREMHQAPELSGEEFETTEKLRGLVSEYTTAISVLESGRGFYVDLDLDRQSENRNMPTGGLGASNATPFDELPRIGVRSDIDALPIQDEKDVEYKSCVPSVMHACGHDAHSAIGYGTIIALRRLHDRGLLPCSIRMRSIFQPAEETCAGAKEVIASGAVDDLDGLFAVHVDPSRHVGTIGWRDGAMTANCDEIIFDIHGRGGHGARPYETDDPIAASALLTTALIGQIPRSIDSHHPVVFSIGMVEAGSNSNVIPSRAKLRGTLRTLDDLSRQEAIDRIKRVSSGIAAATGTKVSVSLGIGGPAVQNDPTLIRYLVNSATTICGEDGIDEIGRPSMGSEDFAFYRNRVPIAMIRLGSRSQHMGHYPLHTPHFDIDERAIVVGVEVMARAVIQWASDIGRR